MLSGGLDHRPQATGADVPALCHAVDDQNPGLNIRFEHAVRPPLREAHIVAKRRRLATDLTLAGHVENPSALMYLNYASLTPRVEIPIRQLTAPGLDSTRATKKLTISPEMRTTAQILVISGFLAWHA